MVDLTTNEDHSSYHIICSGSFRQSMVVCRTWNNYRQHQSQLWRPYFLFLSLPPSILLLLFLAHLSNRKQCQILSSEWNGSTENRQWEKQGPERWRHEKNSITWKSMWNVCQIVYYVYKWHSRRWVDVGNTNSYLYFFCVRIFNGFASHNCTQPTPTNQQKAENKMYTNIYVCRNFNQTECRKVGRNR